MKSFGWKVSRNSTFAIQVVVISQDSFYRELDKSEQIKAKQGLFNFDHPSAFNEMQLSRVLEDVLAAKKVVIPLYDYKNNAPWV